MGHTTALLPALYPPIITPRATFRLPQHHTNITPILERTGSNALTCVLSETMDLLRGQYRGDARAPAYTQFMTMLPMKAASERMGKPHLTVP